METRTQAIKEFSIDMSREQLIAVNQAFIPHKKDFIRMSLVESNIIFEGIDTANQIKITIGNESVRDEYVGIQFFISKFVLDKLESTMQDKVKLSFQHDGSVWHTLIVDIKGDKIQIGLPIFDETIDTGYTAEAEETINAEALAEALRCVEASVVPHSETLACVEFNKTIQFGSSASLSIYNKPVLKTLKTKIAEDFRRYVNNLCKIGTNITIMNAKNTAGSSVVVFKCENVEYISILPAHRLPDITNIVTGKVSEFKVQIAELKEALERLSIPLMGNDAETIMIAEGNHLSIQVYDIQNRLSYAKVDITETDGDDHARVNVNIKSLINIISVFENDTKAQFGINKNKEVMALVLEDSKQKTYLVSNID